MCYLAMHEPDPAQLERSVACASLASPAEGLAEHQIAEALGGQRRRRQPMAERARQDGCRLSASPTGRGPADWRRTS